MEKSRRLIKKESLGKLYSGLQEKYRIYAPVVSEDKQVEFRYNPGFEEVTFDHIRSALSVKNLVFPRVEKVLSYTNSKTESTIKGVDPGKVQNVVLWGSHPCDNAAFDALRSIFLGDTEDEFFRSRLEKMVVIGFSCHKSDEYCFCTSVGLAPDSSKGSDILLSKTASGDYLADIITEKGIEIVNLLPVVFTDPAGQEPVITEVKKKFDHTKVTSNLSKSFEHPFWKENSLRCLGCGACAYVCPTCACFDIQDETRGKNGIRYRSWDSCGFSLFTLHTSGHNPRHVQSQRWRQRIMHKFSYMPDRNNLPGCVGCGRCSSACPVDMNIAEQLEALENI
jgi:formate hydrogenlyase subunit 6/NADH:ubiquinone oxidoreductase subunit I